MSKYCDNVDCQSSSIHTLYKVELKSDFDSVVCNWCTDCIKRDKDMIENILKREKKINYKLNDYFNII